MSARVLFYVQHLLGVGHVRRAAAIASAMAAQGLEVSVAMGGQPVPLVDFAGAALFQLPPVRTADMSFSTLLDGDDNPVDQAWWTHRSAELMALYEHVRPDIIFIEHFPFGRRIFKTELEPMLERAKGKARIICSVRDVLVAKPDEKKNDKITDLIERYFDHVFVHGQAGLIPFTATFEQARRFADKISYTGYVTSPTQNAGRDKDTGRGEILVSAGGGAVGGDLLRAGLEAARHEALKPYRWRILAGDNLDKATYKTLQDQAPENATVEPARADFKLRLANCALSISQGGYNTVMDVIAAGCPNLIAPFASGAETEQSFRAEYFDRLGLINMFKASDLGVKPLAGAAIAAMETELAKNTMINLDGANQTATMIREILGKNL